MMAPLSVRDQSPFSETPSSAAAPIIFAPFTNETAPPRSQVSYVVVCPSALLASQSPGPDKREERPGSVSNWPLRRFVLPASHTVWSELHLISLISAKLLPATRTT